VPTYLDIHDMPGVMPSDAARAHQLDLHIQHSHGVNYVKYWLNEKSGKIYCLCTAPSAEAADAVHREAHGLTAARIMEVTEEVAEAFMGAAETNAAGAVLLPDNAGRDPGTRTILFTDIVNSTSMTQRLGDELALAVLKAHDRIVRDALNAAGGREVKHTGDGIMAVFHSAASSVRCAMAVRHGILRHRDENPAEPLELRIGLAAGEPIEHHEDLFGSTVQLAARLCARAEPGQILLSNAVAELCIGKALPLEPVGHVELKGFDQPVHVHRVQPGAETSLSH
jgi:class 3 adenylate cyclase